MLQRYSNIVFNNFKCVNPTLNKTSITFVRTVSEQTKDVKERLQQKQILQENLGFSYSRSAALLRHNVLLQQIDNKKLLHTILSLKKMGIQSEDICEFPMSLAIHNNSVEHNAMYLREAGFTHISAQILLRFRSIVKKPISLLKAHNIIPDDTHVPKRLFSYLKPAPNYFPIVNQFTDEDSIIHIHEIIFKHYLVWRLESTMSEIERVFKTYDRFKYKSFEIISDMIKLLTEELQFSNQKVLQHGYLLQTGPQTVRTTMKTFPKLAGAEIKSVFYKYPKLIAVSVESLTTILKLLKDFGISDDAIRKCYEIFTLSPESVRFRLQELQSIPEFEVLRKNQRIVQLVLSQNKAKLRLEHLRKLNVKCASINVLCASDTVFGKYVQEGNDRTKGFDLVNFLAQELHDTYKVIRHKLSDNPHWCHVPLTTVQSTLKFLLQHQFARREISRLPILLLYPRDKVREALREISRCSDICEPELRPHEKLNLCLYFIERKHHFSGDGVWHKVDTS
ncbi:mitochondrial transcription termination factor 5 [Carabus blaptoides fortunei]